MKYLGFLAAGFVLLSLGAAPPDNGPLLPGFPDIRSNASLLEVPGKDGKPLLKIVRADFDVVDGGTKNEHRAVYWLLELQTDINTDEKMMIDRAWFNTATYTGPSAFFFDKDKIAINARDLKITGKLFEGKKGDRVRVYFEVGKELPFLTSMEIRRP